MCRYIERKREERSKNKEAVKLKARRGESKTESKKEHINKNTCRNFKQEVNTIKRPLILQTLKAKNNKKIRKHWKNSKGFGVGVVYTITGFELRKRILK